MDEIEGWWVGAMDGWNGKDIQRVAAEVGWERLLDMGPSDLAYAFQLEADEAARWVYSPSRKTRGLAITLADPRYPTRLRDLDHAPPVLCVEGDPAAWDRKCVAVVGTRECTAYGDSLARQIGIALARADVCVVSGLARGIDAAAHRGALHAGGRTVAVLGHGLAFTAPPSNRGLREKIVASGGAVVSTWADSIEPDPNRFPFRNRWISGMVSDVIVVEAPRKSGTLHTVNFGLKQNRQIWAVPGPVGAQASRACLDLIGEGGKVVKDVDELAAHFRDEEPRRRAAPWLSRLFGGATVDEVAAACGRTTQAMLTELGRMETRGLVVRLPGQRYARGGGMP